MRRKACRPVKAGSRRAKAASIATAMVTASIAAAAEDAAVDAAIGAKAVRRQATSALRKRPATWADKRADKTRLPRITSPHRKAGRIACPRNLPK